MDKIIEIIDSCTTFAQLELFYTDFLTNASRDEHHILIAKGAYMLKLHQYKKQHEASWKPERFPATDEQPLNVIE